MSAVLKRAALFLLLGFWLVLSLAFLVGIYSLYSFVFKWLEPKWFPLGTGPWYWSLLQLFIAISAMFLPLWAFSRFVQLGFDISNRLENRWFRKPIAGAFSIARGNDFSNAKSNDRSPTT